MYGDTTVIRRLAVELRGRADEIRGEADRLVARTDAPAGWGRRATPCVSGSARARSPCAVRPVGTRTPPTPWCGTPGRWSGCST